MERFDIQMFTSAWSRYYDDAHKGTWMPLMGTWSHDQWYPSQNLLYTGADANLNPSPMDIIMLMRNGDQALTVTITYRTATQTGWETGSKYRNIITYYPIYTDAGAKTITITIPAFAEAESIHMLPDSLIWKITSVSVSGGYGLEEFGIWALASPTPRILFGLGWNELIANIMRLKRGTWAALSPCPTCLGGGVVNGSTCPACGGYFFDGNQATAPLLDLLGDKVGLGRHTSETDIGYAKRIWTRKWEIIPTKAEILRYFKHFCDVKETITETDPITLITTTRPLIEIIDTAHLQEPTFFVAVSAQDMGVHKLWDPLDENLDYDGMVENACPAGVNGYFDWLGFAGEELAIADDSSNQPWGFEEDNYGSDIDISSLMDNFFGEFTDWSQPNYLSDFQHYINPSYVWTAYLNGDSIPTKESGKWSLIIGAGGFISQKVDDRQRGQMHSTVQGVRTAVLGTFPMISGLTFANYKVKFDAMIPSGLVDTYPLEFGVSEAFQTAQANLRIDLLFKNDGKVYSEQGGSDQDTGITWTASQFATFEVHTLSSSTFKLVKKNWHYIVQYREWWTFEDGSLADFTVTHVTVSTDHAHGGTRSAKFDSTSFNATMSRTDAHTYMSAWFYTTDAGNSLFEWWDQDPANPPYIRAYFDPQSGQVWIYDHTTPHNIGSYSSNTWFKLGFVQHPDTKTVDYYINDVLAYAGAQWYNTSGTDYGFWEMLQLHTVSRIMYIDDIQIDPVNIKINDEPAGIHESIPMTNQNAFSGGISNVEVASTSSKGVYVDAIEFAW